MGTGSSKLEKSLVSIFRLSLMGYASLKLIEVTYEV